MATAAVSLDKGLAHALHTITTETGVGATCRVADVPLEPVLAKHLAMTGFWKPTLGLTGDHEILIALPADKTTGAPLNHCIGEITEDDEVQYRWPDRD